MKTFSSKEVAQIFQCNESTVRRWTYKGMLQCHKTPGGHRHFSLYDLRQFISKHQPRYKDKILSLSSNNANSIDNFISSSDYSKLAKYLMDMSLEGNDSEINNMMNKLYLSGTKLYNIFDDIVEKNYDLIESLLEKNKISHSEEYVARKLITRSIENLCDNKPNKASASKRALCINFEDNLPDIGIIMTEVILRHLDFNVYNTGSQGELGDLSNLIRKQKISVLIFYLCNRQCCNAIATSKLEKTSSEIDSILEYSSKNNIKILFGGEGVKLINNKNLNLKNTFTSFRDLERLINEMY